MIPCAKYFLFYLLSIPIHIGLLVGVALLTEMMVAVQFFIFSTLFFHFHAWKVNFSWRDMGGFIFVGLICHLLIVYIAICGSLVAANGIDLTFAGWIASVCVVSLLLCCKTIALPKSEKKYRILSTIISLATLSLLVCLILSIFGQYTTQPFSKSEQAFEPFTINEKTLEKPRGGDTIADSRCYAPSCNRFIFDTQYSIRSARSFPLGFRLEKELESARGVKISYVGNGTLSDYCQSFEIFVKCSAVYEASIGSLWIGKDCPSSAKNPLLPNCLPIDTASATFSFWLGVGSIFCQGYLLWLYLESALKVTDEENAVEMESADNSDNQ